MEIRARISGSSVYPHVAVSWPDTVDPTDEINGNTPSVLISNPGVPGVENGDIEIELVGVGAAAPALPFLGSVGFTGYWRGRFFHPTQVNRQIEIRSATITIAGTTNQPPTGSVPTFLFDVKGR